VKTLAQSHTEDAIRTLVEIMKNPKYSAVSRVSAAVAILDRGWGKPSQMIVTDGDMPGVYVHLGGDPSLDEWMAIVVPRCRSNVDDEEPEDDDPTTYAKRLPS
jgi:hypothetical protein